MGNSEAKPGTAAPDREWPHSSGQALARQSLPPGWEAQAGLEALGNQL